MAESGGHAGDNAAHARRFLDIHGCMARIRAFEEAALAAQSEGRIHGSLHLSIGQEAVAAGVCAGLARDDLITSTHRGHGHAIAKGADVGAMMAELFGRATGTCRGKGGSMHIADFSVGMLGANGVVAGGIGIAVGAAQGLRLRGRDSVVACFFGDGAVNRGPFLEGLNWARIYHLPVLFVCEDNGFAALTRPDRTTGGGGPAARAESIGIPATVVDGNDAVAVTEAAGELLSTIRAGGGPRLLHTRTFRIDGHTTADRGLYRSADEMAAQRARDPIAALAARLADWGVAAEEIASVAAAARREMAAAVAAAEAAPWPAPDAALADVQDLGAPRWP